MAGKDFIDVAEGLIEGPSEAHWRSATSRAYYAAFHHARDALADKSLTVPSNSRSHQMVYRCLNNASNPELDKAATGLGTLRTSRLHADYDFGGDPSRQKQAVFDVNLAKAVMAHIEQSPLKAGSEEAVVQAIREYLRQTNQKLA